MTKNTYEPQIPPKLHKIWKEKPIEEKKGPQDIRKEYMNPAKQIITYRNTKKEKSNKNFWNQKEEQQYHEPPIIPHKLIDNTVMQEKEGWTAVNPQNINKNQSKRARNWRTQQGHKCSQAPHSRPSKAEQQQLIKINT